MTTKLIRTYTNLHKVAFGVGALCVGVTVGSNVEHIVKQSGTIYDPAVFAAFAVSVGVVFALAAAMDAFEDWRKLSSWVNGSALFACYVFGAAYELSTTFDRTASLRDQTLQRTWKGDKQHEELVALYTKVSYMAARTCGEEKGGVKKVSISTACSAIRNEVDIAQERLDQRRAELDPLGKRVAWMSMGYLDVTTASNIQPLFLPIALFLMGSFFVAYGVKGRLVPAEFSTELTGMAAKEDKARRFIEAYWNENNSLPSVAQVCKIVGVSDPTARKYLRKMRSKA